MSLGHGAKIVTDGLVFHYDMENAKKSWKGMPTENVIASAGKNCAAEYSGTSYPFVSQNITTQVQAAWAAGKTKFSMQFEGKRDYYQGGTGGGNDGYPYMYIYFTDWSWSSSFGISTYEWSHGKRENINLPDPTGKTVYFAIYHMNSGNPGKSYARNFQIEFNAGTSFATPFVNGTRSNTEAILDMVGGNTIIANSLTYNSDGSFEFDGSDDYISIPDSDTLTAANATYEAWIYPTGNNGSTQMGIITKANYGLNTREYQFQVRYNSGVSGQYTVCLSHNNNNTSWVTCGDNADTIINLNETIHVVCTVENGVGNFYINGDLKTTKTGMHTTITNLGAPVVISGTISGTSLIQQFVGDIYIAKWYNKALTPKEVKQNFNTIRGRYGL